MIKKFLLKKKAEKIKLILLDVDGVLTDGGIYYGNKDVEYKKFNIMDGSGIKMALHVGIQIAIITGRKSEIMQRRAKELGIKKVYQGVLKKHKILNRLLRDFHINKDEIAFVSDDVIDYGLLKQVGVKVAVKNACSDIKKEADIITTHKGGEGAVREFIEYLLKKKKLWKKAKERYL